VIAWKLALEYVVGIRLDKFHAFLGIWQHSSTGRKNNVGRCDHTVYITHIKHDEMAAKLTKSSYTDFLLNVLNVRQIPNGETGADIITNKKLKLHY
jgi:hypothetical protein